MCIHKKEKLRLHNLKMPLGAQNDKCLILSFLWFGLCRKFFARCMHKENLRCSNGQKASWIKSNNIFNSLSRKTGVPSPFIYSSCLFLTFGILEEVASPDIWEDSFSYLTKSNIPPPLSLSLSEKLKEIIFWKPENLFARKYISISDVSSRLSKLCLYDKQRKKE